MELTQTQTATTTLDSSKYLNDENPRFQSVEKMPFIP